MVKIRYYPEREGRKGKRVVKGGKRKDKVTPTITLESGKAVEVSEDDYTAIEQNQAFKNLVTSKVIEVTKPRKKSTKNTGGKNKNNNGGDAGEDPKTPNGSDDGQETDET